MRYNPVIVVLILSVLFIVSAEIVPLVRDHVFVPLLVLLIVCGLFLAKRQRADAILVGCILLWYIAAKLLFPSLDNSTLVLRASAILSFCILTLVLLIGPWSFFSKRVLSWYHYRRHLGVSALLVAYLHVALVMTTYYNLSVDQALQNSFTVFGLSAFMIMLWLGVTSWDLVQKKVKPWMWGSLHSVLLLLYIALIYKWFAIQKNDSFTPIFLAWMGLFIIYWIASSPLVIRFVMKTKPFGWKQVHSLVHVAYGSLVLHVFFGILLQKEWGIKIMFFSFPVIVYLSHASGWLKRVIDDHYVRQNNRTISRTIMESGKQFIGVARLDQLKQGKGKKVLIGGKPIALFMHNNEVRAVSDVCAHQKGPLHKGRILGEFVECPWHHWTYNLKDGCGPPGFHDCVPCYPVKVVEGVVFVAEQPVTKVTHS